MEGGADGPLPALCAAVDLELMHLTTGCCFSSKFHAMLRNLAYLSII
jgi:hypothetical protein